MQQYASYEEFSPTVAVAGFVACFWSFCIPSSGSSFQHLVVPDGTVSVVFIRTARAPFPLLRISGPRTSALRVSVDPGDLFWGVRLLPGASGPLLGVPARQLRDCVQSLSAVSAELSGKMLGKLTAADTAAQGFAAIESELARLAARAPAIDPLVCRATTRFLRTQGNAKVNDLAIEASLSERQFRRRFYDSVGLSPKEFSRAVRVRCACIEIASSSRLLLSAIAQDAGYSDQAHLSREFASVFGLPAGDLSALLRGFEHGEFKGT